MPDRDSLHDLTYNPDAPFDPRATELRDLITSNKGARFQAASIGLRLALSQARATGKAPRFDKEWPIRTAALVELLAKFSPSQNCVIPLSWIGHGGEITPESIAFRDRAAQILASGVWAFDTRLASENLTADLLAVAFGADAVSITLGDLFTGVPLFPEPPKWPQDLGRFGDLMGIACVGEIRAGLGGLAAAGIEKPHNLPGATITSIDPPHGCPGDTITIRGSGFGQTQPPDVQVFFPGRNATTVVATVMYWTDAAITVIVPTNVGHGCIKLVQTPSGFAAIFGASQALAGALETCLGATGLRGAGAIRNFGEVAVSYTPPCTGPAANFIGGPPIIDSFLANARTVASIAPNTAVTLSWNVSGADALEIRTVGARPLPLPSQLFVLNATGQWLSPILSLHDGESGAYELRAINTCGTTKARVDIVCRGKQALLLAGGGTKGAFEVGAVQCLYDVRRFKPDIIIGASAGALNAAKLAEGAGALVQLRSMWLGLQDEPDFFLREPWFALLELKVQAFLASGSSNVGFAIGSRVVSMAADKILESLVGLMGVPGWVYTVITSLYPAVTTVIDIARLLDAAKQAASASSIFDPAPLAALIANNISASTIAQSGIKLRFGMISLETGQEELVTENSTLLSSGFNISLNTALLGAVAIPIAFPPVAVSPTARGTEHFIDGGTRNNIPFRAAAEAGADRIIGIMPSPRGMAQKNFSGATLIDIAPRALEILLDEVQEDDIAPYRGFGVPTELAMPSFLVHDTLTVDPGLISINMDYGWMRAFDDLVASNTQRSTLRQSSDDIIAARVDAWALEHFVNGERLHPLASSQIVPIPDPQALSQLRTLKQRIRSLAAARLALAGSTSMPPQTAPWWQEFERHKWQTFIPSPWASIASRLGTLGTAPVPPPL